MSQYQENIHIAILGPVSAGKSTFLNALLSNTYSDMMRKKTTMLPQIYQTTNSLDIDSVEAIKEKNRKSNEEILKMRESGQYNQSHFKELVYKVKPINNFIELPDKKCTYGLCDMPGLNCSGGGDVMYYNYLEQNSHKIDVYILVFDINSALNTTDEVKILQEVNKYIQKNKHGYVHILVNKCDYVEFEDNNKFKFTDEELNDLYKRVQEIVDKNITNLPNNQKVSISPICSSDLYIFRAAIDNIESLDENQLDDIIKKECGKREFLKLQKEGIDKKRKYIKGLIKDTKTYNNVWMKDTGYNLFCNSINKIMQNYSQIILYHIEQDVDKILVGVRGTGDNFDDITNNLEIINNRFKNLVSTYNNKCKIEEIIPQSIKIKLDEITQSMNAYLVAGINTYSGNTRENAESFISKIGKFFTKVSNLFKTNPLASSEEKLKLKRIELINNNLAEKYNPEDFTELYTTKNIDLTKYTQSIANTLDKKYMTFNKLLESVKKITNNDEKFMNVIINKFTSSYKADTKFDEFIINLELIANVTNNNLDIMWSVIECQLKAINNATFYQVYHYWINLNSVNILQETDEIKYIMFKVDNYIIQLMSSKYERFDTFKQHMNDMQNLYKLLAKLIGKKTTNIIDEFVDFNQEKQTINVNVNVKKTKKDKLIDMTDDEFLDATDGEKTETEIDDKNSEKSDDYNDSDDSDTVFRKATKNTSVRTNKRVNKGVTVKTLTK